MLTRRIAGATHRFGAPQDWDEAKDGRCGTLSVRLTADGFCESAWEPTPEELAALNQGGSVILRIKGGQPPVALYVEQPDGGTNG